MTTKNMVVVTIATIINSTIKHVLNGSCLSSPRRETNFEENSDLLSLWSLLGLIISAKILGHELSQDGFLC